MHLNLINVHASYGTKEILRGVNINLKAGEILALIGSNGAGKTTILRVTTGLLSVSKGAIELLGANVTRSTPLARFRAGLGYLMQGGAVFPTMSVRENIDLGLIGLSSKDHPDAIARAFYFLPQLKSIESRRAGLLSGGQRQALALAMVLARRPKLLLLDEPAAGLAPSLADGFLTTVQQLNRELGITILLVEQRVRNALNIAHRAAILRNGVVVAKTDSPTEWLDTQELARHFFQENQAEPENTEQNSEK